MPLTDISRRSQSPSKEFPRIVESEHIVFIFDIVFVEEVVDLSY